MTRPAERDVLAGNVLAGGVAGDVLGGGTTLARRGVAVGAVAQVAAKVVHLGLNVVSTLAVVRHLAPGAYGVYAIVLSVTSLTAFLADFGLPKLAVREITAGTTGASSRPAGPVPDAGRVVGTVLGLRLALAVIAIGVTELILLAMRQPAAAYAAGAIASLTGLGEAVLASLVVVFQVRLAQQWEAFLRTGAELVETIAIVALVAAGAGLGWLFVPPAVCTAVAGGAAYLLVRNRFAVRPRFERSRVSRLLRQAAPIAPALLVSVLYRKLDTLSLAALRPSRDVGIYSAAAQPVEYVLLTTALLMNTVFPLMAAAYGRGELDRFALLYRRGTEALVLLTLAFPLLLLFLARPLATRVYGRAYAGAATPLVLLSVAMVLTAVTVWQSLALLLGGCQAVTLRYNLTALVVAGGLCAALVPTFGIAGAGAGAIATATFVVHRSTAAVRRRLGVRLHRAPFVRIAAAAASAAAVLAVLAALHLSWLAAGAVGLGAYAVAVRLTGAHRSLLGVVA